MYKKEELYARISSLSVLRGLLDDGTVMRFAALVSPSGITGAEAAGAYSAFVSSLFEKGTDSLSCRLKDLLTGIQDPYIGCLVHNRPVPPLMKDALDRDLETVSMISSVSCGDLLGMLGLDGCAFLPRYGTEPFDAASYYYDMADNIGTAGYGIYARNTMFQVRADGEIVPSDNPDRISLDDLIGYRREKDIVINNTLKFLSGEPAFNILLSGDAGTGKSSTIKAVANHYRDRGLRIIEIRKDQLGMIRDVMKELRYNPLKFIIFLDDLSFDSDDDNFNRLKTFLEGSLNAINDNVLIYATSNRRHIVRESFADRDGSEIHRNDTIQEYTSLADRFGIRVTYRLPNKEEYLNIVRELTVRKFGSCTNEICAEAEKYALAKGGRSPRCAKQFAETLRSL